MKNGMVLGALYILTLAGCANLSSVYRTLDTSNNQGALIDIKQRAILAGNLKEGEGNSQSHAVVCAEPSPDSLSAYAFDLAAQGNLPAGKALGLTLGSAESAAYVGLRTQSIQLLRDQFFRACEAYMNKAINSAEYAMLIRRYQKQTAALLAIEQLTSTVSAPAAIVNASGAAKGSTAAFLQGVFAENKEKLAALDEHMKATGTTDDQKKADQTEIDRLNKQNDEIIQSLKNATPLGSGTAASGESKETTPENNLANASGVAEAVKHIVDGITQTDDFLSLCIVNYSQPGDPKIIETTPAASQGSATGAPVSDVSSVAKKTVKVAAKNESIPGDMREACMVRMGIANEAERIENSFASAYLENVMNDDTRTPAQKLEALGNYVSPRKAVSDGTKVYSALISASDGTVVRLMHLSDQANKPVIVTTPEKKAPCKNGKACR